MRSEKHLCGRWEHSFTANGHTYGITLSEMPGDPFDQNECVALAADGVCIRETLPSGDQRIGELYGEMARHAVRLFFRKGGRILTAANG